MVIKEDPAEQLSPTFAAKRSIFQGSQNLAKEAITDQNKKKHMTNRERENDRVSSIGRGNFPQGNLSKVNINFANDSQMTSSGTKLVGLPSKDDSKVSGKNGALGGPIKKTLQSTNSTSLLDTMANSNNSSALNSSLNKGNQFLPNFRQKQHKDTGLQSLHHNTSVSPPKQKQGSFGPQQKLQSIYAMSFPSLDEEKGGSGSGQNKMTQHGSQK